MKKISSLMLLALVFVLFGCRQEELYHENSTNQTGDLKKGVFINFSSFKKETNTTDFEQFKKNEDLSSSKKTLNDHSDLFIVDTASVKKLVVNNQTSYTFKVFNSTQNQNNYYNLVVHDNNGEWIETLLHITKNANGSKEINIVQDSHYGHVHSNKSSVAAKTACIGTADVYQFHCTCPPSYEVCDMCSECVSYHQNTFIYDCGIDEGSGTGPVEGGSPGGAGTGPNNTAPSPYNSFIFSSVDDLYLLCQEGDATCLDNMVKLYATIDFFKDLGIRNSDISTYNDLFNTVHNYLEANNYSDASQLFLREKLISLETWRKQQDNSTDEKKYNNYKFVNWAVNFYIDNPTITTVQFQNWFTNGYSDTYRTKLSLLSPTEIQEFVNINTEIDASPYDEEFVKEANEAFVAFTAYGDIDTMTDAQIQTVLNQCCPSIIVVPQAMTIEKSRMIVATYRFNRKFYPEWSKTKCFWEASRETIQLLLDLGGLAPVIGEVCDLTNGVIYTIQGDGLNASLSYASAIPVAGWFAAGSKYGVKVINASDIASRQVLKWIVGNDGLIKFGYSSQLRKVLKLTDATKQAHHIIPWAYNIQIHSVVQKAAKSADAFHLNEALNGIAVASWRNQPNHNVYNNKIFSKLELFKNSNPNATPQECYNFLNDLIGDVRTWIINHPNSHLNDLVLP